jgi:restriction system protein
VAGSTSGHSAPVKNEEPTMSMYHYQLPLMLPPSVHSDIPSLVIQGLIVPETNVSEGILVKSFSLAWLEVAQKLGRDWSLAMQLTPRQWEEMVAGAFDKASYRVVLTPSSGDYGRDLIATKSGTGAVRLLGSVKRYAPDHRVDAEACRSLLGVLNMDPNATKGIITTTSEFAPGVYTDPSIAPAVPYRLELKDGKQLQEWLNELSSAKP